MSFEASKDELTPGSPDLELALAAGAEHWEEYIVRPMKSSSSPPPPVGFERNWLEDIEASMIPLDELANLEVLEPKTLQGETGLSDGAPTTFIDDMVALLQDYDPPPPPPPPSPSLNYEHEWKGKEKLMRFSRSNDGRIVEFKEGSEMVVTDGDDWENLCGRGRLHHLSSSSYVDDRMMMMMKDEEKENKEENFEMNLRYPMTTRFEQQEDTKRGLETPLHTLPVEYVYHPPLLSRNYGIRSHPGESTRILGNLDRVESDRPMNVDLMMEEESSQKMVKLFKTRKKKSDSSLDQLVIVGSSTTMSPRSPQLSESSESPYGSKRIRTSSKLGHDDGSLLPRREWVWDPVQVSSQKSDRLSSPNMQQQQQQQQHLNNKNDRNRDSPRDPSQQPRPSEQKNLLKEKRDNYACLKELFNHLETIVPHQMEKISRGNLIFKTISYIHSMKSTIYRLLMELEQLKKENTEMMKRRYGNDYFE